MSARAWAFLAIFAACVAIVLAVIDITKDDPKPVGVKVYVQGDPKPRTTGVLRCSTQPPTPTLACVAAAK